MSLKEDANWPRVAAWLKPADGIAADIAVFGVPANSTSISPTGADKTPAAIREALLRYSLQSSTGDLGTLVARDFGDIADPDSNEGATSELAARLTAESKLTVALGGDNSITFAVAKHLRGGLITFDAHHDIREGVSNGSPVRRLIDEAGFDPKRIVQIGINDFSNSPEYSRRAKALGITVITREDLSRRTPEDVIAQALDISGDDTHVDFDVDVCDRAFVPACPASAPGGISAFELRTFANLVTRSSSVRSIDITEIDATMDAPDQRTIRLGALLILESAKGLLAR
jgi:arginase family enzyme